MAKVTKEEIDHLATLARIAVDDTEAEKLSHEFDAILAYVDQLNEIAAADENNSEGKKSVGSHYNILREDGDPHEPGMYTEKLLSAAPIRDGQYMSVKKILKDG